MSERTSNCRNWSAWLSLFLFFNDWSFTFNLRLFIFLIFFNDWSLNFNLKLFFFWWNVYGSRLFLHFLPLVKFHFFCNLPNCFQHIMKLFVSTFLFFACDLCWFFNPFFHYSLRLSLTYILNGKLFRQHNIGWSIRWLLFFDWFSLWLVC